MDRNESAQLYNQKDVDGCHPISPIDVLIIDAIVDALKNEVNPIDVAETLFFYKRDSDETVLHRLHMLPPGEVVKKKAVPFIEINGQIFKVQYLVRIEKSEEFDEFNKQISGILINRGPLAMPIASYENTFIPFNSVTHRNNEWNLMKDKLQEFTTIKFL